MSSGQAFLQQGSDKYILSEKDGLCLLPNLNHKSFQASNRPLSFYWMHFLGKVDLLDENQIKAVSSSDNHHLYIPMNFECLSKERLVVLIHQLLHLERSHYHKEAKNCAFKSILHEIHHANFRDHDKTIASKIEIINQWIHANFANDVDYHSVANYLGYNKDYLNKYYKSQTGMTINQKITHTRLMHAKSFLSESNKSIKEIAFEVGFKDVKFFMKKFKEQEMLTPTSYRKCFYKKHINTK